MSSSSPGKPPPHTIVVSGSLARVDVGLAVSAVVRTLWSEIETRAGLVMELDAWGPVMGDEMLLQRLLQSIVLSVLRHIPAGAPALHLLALSSRAGPDETLLVEVRHLRRDGSGRPQTDPSELSTWNRQAAQLTGRVEQLADPHAACCYRLSLQLAN